MQNNSKLATLGGGCFWCLEAVFQRVNGVSLVQSGYCGDTQENAVYKKVCSGQTKHAEVVQVTFDEGVLKYKELLKIFFHIHDPTTLNRQGNDSGPQYRSIILYHDEQQKQIANEIIKELQEEKTLLIVKTYSNPIVTEIVPFTKFFVAEGYHQNYFNDNPNQGYCRAVVDPKVKKLLSKFGSQVKSEYSK